MKNDQLLYSLHPIAASKEAVIKLEDASLLEWLYII